MYVLQLLKRLNPGQVFTGQKIQLPLSSSSPAQNDRKADVADDKNKSNQTTANPIPSSVAAPNAAVTGLSLASLSTTDGPTSQVLLFNVCSVANVIIILICYLHVCIYRFSYI